MTSLGGDARETLTIAGLEKAKERSLEHYYRDGSRALRWHQRNPRE